MLYKKSEIPKPYGKRVVDARVMYTTDSPDLAELGYRVGFGNQRMFITHVQPEDPPRAVMTADGLMYDVTFVCYGFPWDGPPPDSVTEA